MNSSHNWPAPPHPNPLRGEGTSLCTPAAVALKLTIYDRRVGGYFWLHNNRYIRFFREQGGAASVCTCAAPPHDLHGSYRQAIAVCTAIQLVVTITIVTRRVAARCRS